MRRTVASGLALAFLALGALTACAPSAAPSVSATAGTAPAPQPTFDGPFAAEYTEAWRNAETDVVRGVLADEAITDQEWSETLTGLTRCLAEAGITLTEYNTDGSYTADVGTRDGEAVNQDMGACEKRSGEVWIGHLYRAQSTNPDNIPETELVTDCLVRNRAVPPGYTVENYLADVQDMSSFLFVDDAAQSVLGSCSEDPSYNR